MRELLGEDAGQAPKTRIGGKSRYQYSETKKVGAWAVERLMERWLSLGFRVDSVEDDPFFQVLDIDVVLHGPSPRTYIEVKGDRYTTGNIYIETVSNVHADTPGCLIYTGADFIAYYFLREGRCIMIPVPALKRWIRENQSRYPEKVVGPSRGFPVPVPTILHEVDGCWVVDQLPTLEGEL